jgi:DNA repair protein RadC
VAVTDPVPLHPVLQPDRRGVAALHAKLVRSGPAACGDDELLAILLRGPRPLETARRLLEEHDGLSGLRGLVAGARVGLDPRTAGALLAAIELGRRAAATWPTERWRIRTPADLAERLMPEMSHLEREELRVVLLNTKNAVTGIVTVYAGNLAGSSVRVGEVFRDAVRRQAAALVVAHNHPSGDPAPSAEDLRITAELADAGRLLDIELLDHLVIGHGRWASLRALGAI